MLNELLFFNTELIDIWIIDKTETDIIKFINHKGIYAKTIGYIINSTKIDYKSLKLGFIKLYDLLVIDIGNKNLIDLIQVEIDKIDKLD